jgi:magnesium transporter
MPPQRTPPQEKGRMLKEYLKPDVLERIEARDWAGLESILADWPAPEVADLLLHLRKTDRVLFFRALPRGTASDVFGALEFDQQAILLRDLTDEESRHLLAGLPPDDRTQLISELPGQATQRLLNLLPPGDLDEARQLLGYPEESVGRLMTPDYVAVRPDWSVAEALDHIRAQGRDSETINVVFVTDDRWHLLGAIELRHLIIAPTDARVADLGRARVTSLRATAPREHAVQLFRRYALIALPIVDAEDVLLGIVTVDDVLGVAEQEATEDFHRVGSVGPLRTSLRDAAIGYLYRRRIVWLLALVFMNVFSGAGIAYFEDTISALVALVFFLPLLIDSGGNAGSQSATLIIRALATGDVRARDWPRLLGREFMVALLMGLTMAAGVSAIAYFRAPEVLPVVALTMTTIVLVGSMLGMLLPFVLTRLKLDPATASAPLITSLADISGVLIYFSIATWLLREGIAG